MTDEVQYKERPRDMARRAKRGLCWCPVCDMALVSDGGKCKSCGSHINRKRDKHVAPIE